MIDKSLLYDHEVTSVSQSFTHSVFEQKKKQKKTPSYAEF